MAHRANDGSAPRTTGVLFKPDETGWHVEVFDDGFSVAAVRRSPWCDDRRHLEGYADMITGWENVYDAPSLEERISNLKEMIEINSAGWGTCKTCHPGADYDQKRADAKMGEVNSR